MLPDVLPDESARTGDVYRTHLVAFQEVDRQIALALSLLPGPDDPGLLVKRTRGLGPRIAIITTALFAKQIKTTRAIARVAAGGLGEDAMALVRVQFETMVAIAWLLQKSSRLRTNLYLAYHTVNGLKTLGKWKGTKGLKRQATKGIVASYTTRLAEQAAALRITPQALTDKVRRHWSGLGSLEEVLGKLRSAGPPHGKFSTLVVNAAAQ